VPAARSFPSPRGRDGYVFGRKNRGGEQEVLEGVMTFFGSHHALRSERVLKDAGFPVRLIPGPREISPNCGVALRFPYERRDEVVGVLERNSVQFESVHHYP
jgi:hypothetical protein